MKSLNLLFYVFCAVIFTNCNNNGQNEITKDYFNDKYETPIFHKSHEPKKQNVPFSDAVQVGNTFYLAGQIGMDHSIRELVSGGIEAETIKALENIREVLSVHKLHFKDVVKVTVILDDIENFSLFNSIYETYFPQKPARTTFAVKALAKGAKIEIEVIAVKSVDSHTIHG